jgi:hypothetical protein
VGATLDASRVEAQSARTVRSDDEDDEEGEDRSVVCPPRRPRRQLSGFESIDETVDPDLERDSAMKR